MSKLNWSILFLVIGNIFAFFQLQGHYVFPKFAQIMRHPLYVLILAIPCSLLFFYSTKMSYEHFGYYWNIRLIGFGIGTIIFGLFTFLLLHELPSWKNVLGIVLAAVIIILQIMD